MTIAGALAVAFGGAVGAVLRYLADLWTLHRWGPGWPISTLSVNVVGSAVLGLLTGLSLQGSGGGVVAAAGVGFCGALTTFSASRCRSGIWPTPDGHRRARPPRRRRRGSGAGAAPPIWGSRWAPGYWRPLIPMAILR